MNLFQIFVLQDITCTGMHAGLSFFSHKTGSETNTVVNDSRVTGMYSDLMGFEFRV